MARLGHSVIGSLLACWPLTVLAAPSIYPTGTTIYDPERAWSGYTVLSLLATPAVVVIDMNGNVVKRWDDYNNSPGGPARILPGGLVISSAGARPPHQEALELVERDFDGNTIWQFGRNEQIENANGETIWALRQHHDWQRADFPAGYYSPEATPAATGADTLILTHTNHVLPEVSDVMLEDDRIIEVSPGGELLWEWTVGEHIDEFDFSLEARATIENAPGFHSQRNSLDWFHINSATYVGPNRWYDEGDPRFAPDNIIISGRQVSIVAIVGRDGSVVWQLGPDFSRSDEMQAIGQIIGQHHAHLIPRGLPGAGNMMIFDNGGSSGYGAPNAIAPNGLGVYARATSRILEIDPVTLEVVWSHQAGAQFFSTNISGAQRLPNGNTLITEGAGGRLFEVTSDGDIVWEYMVPFFDGPRRSNAVYRGYRLPYGWIPQLERPTENAIVPPELSEYRLQ